MALSILQNGPMPSFLNEDIRNDLFSGKDSSSLCIKNLRTGLDVLGVVKVGSILPMFVHLLNPSTTCLTLKAVTQLLKPHFSEVGSNDRKYGNSVYSAFLRYMRSAASGRNSIEFVKPRDDTRFIPTANTCINSLKLPRGTLEIKLPADEELFSLYDYAFLNTFYGLI